MNEIGSIVAAITGGVGIWAIRVFRTAMTAQAEINAEKNRTIERKDRRIEYLEAENDRLRAELYGRPNQ